MRWGPWALAVTGPNPEGVRFFGFQILYHSCLLRSCARCDEMREKSTYTQWHMRAKKEGVRAMVDTLTERGSMDKPARVKPARV
jgi:hypothetical protein